MLYEGSILIGEAGDKKVCIHPKMANRHGLITGATGTGKTTTLKTLSEAFSDIGVPVFFSDIKGDLSGLATSYPVTFWDIYGKGGIPVRTTISEMGPVLLSKLMGLNDTQTDLLTVAFKIADDENLLLIDTKDLKSLLSFMAENASRFTADYGNIPKQSVNTILRNIVALEAKGADQFFSEPALNLSDFFIGNTDGRGTINILDCRTLINDTTMYSTFLLWMLSELFETLPEAGDMDRPRMVFFFDEAHLIFKDINKALKDKIEQVVKLIRSKGVGIYFISQSPNDIPEEILSQLGNKIQHGLRAYTPKEEKAIKSVADSFRANPEFNTYDVLINLGIGEALISCLDAGGVPCVVEKCKVVAPGCMDNNISEQEITQKFTANNLYLKYKDAVDPDSAFEFFERMKQEEAAVAGKSASKAAKSSSKGTQSALSKGARQVARTAAGSIGRELGKNVGKSLLGSSFGKTLGGNVGAQIGRSILGTIFKG